MPIIKENLVHELSVYYYYTKNKGNYEDNMSRKTSNNAPKQNNGYCKLDIKVIEKTYETNEEFYYISYDWGFKPWGEWGDIHTLNNGNNLLTWDYIHEMEQKLINSKKASPILQKLQKLKALFPFHDDYEFIQDNMNGEVIKKNVMTTEMINALCMTNNELEAISGNTTSYRYRTNIMNAIALFWD